MAHTRNKEMKALIGLCSLGLLCAMQIVLARWLVIPIGTSMRFSLSFIPVVIAARKFGMYGGALVYGLGDFLGAIIFPTGGAFQVGFTVTAVVSGLIFGFFLGENSPINKKGKVKIPVLIIIAVLSSQLLCSLLLNSFWLSFYYGMPFFARLLTRVPQILIIGTLQIIFMELFLEKINTALKKAGI